MCLESACKQSHGDKQGCHHRQCAIISSNPVVGSLSKNNPVAGCAYLNCDGTCCLLDETRSPFCRGKGRGRRGTHYFGLMRPDHRMGLFQVYMLAGRPGQLLVMVTCRDIRT